MNWQDLAGPLIKMGAPLIGTALGGPMGSMIGGSLGNVLGSVLGVAATPDDVDEAIKRIPSAELQEKLSAADAEAQAKWPALVEIAKREVDAQSTALSGVQALAREEIAANDPIQRLWRPIYAFELTIECAAVWSILIYDVLFGEGKIASLLAQNSGILITYWSARFGVLGVFVGGRSWEKVTAEKAAAITAVKKR